MYRNVEIIKELVKAGSYHPTDYHVQIAAENGYLDVVKYLVEEYNCDPKTRDNCAVRGGLTRWVETLSGFSRVMMCSGL